MTRRTIFISLFLFSYFVKNTIAQKQGQELIDSLIAQLPRLKNDTNKAKLLDDISRNYFSIDPDKGIKYGNLSLTLAQKLNWEKGIAGAHNSIGINYSFGKGDYNNALEHYLKALKIREKNNDLGKVAGTLNNIGQVYSEQKDSKKALYYYQKAMAINQKLDNKNWLANNLSNISIEYTVLKQFDKAIEYKLKALTLKEELGDEWGIATNSTQLGNIYAQQGNYNAALDLVDKSLKIFRKHGDVAGIARNLGLIGNIYFEKAKQNSNEQKSDLQKAKLYTDSSIVLLNKTGNIYQLNGQYAIKSGILENLGDAKGALASFKKFHLLNDSIYNIEKNKKLVQQTMQYEFDKKEASLKAEQEKKDITQRNIRNTILFGFAGAIIFLVVVYFQRNKIAKEKKRSDELLIDVSQQKLEVEKQRNIVQHQNTEIISSIEYAKRIQTAILPPPRILKEHLKDYFVLYAPKDIVAGDFYWLEAVDNLIYFAVCDCTGHGVPGAMVSVVCNNALNRSLNEFKQREPGKIFDKTRELVLENFAKSDEEVKDGMDASLGVLNLNERKMQWSGANNPIWIYRKTSNTIEEIKADKQPIGKGFDNKPFTTHHINLFEGDTIYLFTDGYADQFGGDKGKKLTKSKFREFILSIVHYTMEQQKEELIKFHQRYRGIEEQVDDISVIGIKV